MHKLSTFDTIGCISVAKHCHTRQSEAKETHVSLTRKMLKAFGIEEDAIDQIIDAHTETTDALKAERDRQKSKAEDGAAKVSELQSQLDEAKRQAQEASENNDYDQLKERYDTEHDELEKLRKDNEKLQKDFESYKGDVQAKESERAKKAAYEALLGKAGIGQKYMAPVIRVADLSKIELEEDGSVKDADSIIEQVKADWPEFVAKQRVDGAKTENPPEVGDAPKGANPRALKIAKERHERLYGKSEE